MNACPEVCLGDLRLFATARAMLSDPLLSTSSSTAVGHTTNTLAWALYCCALVAVCATLYVGSGDWPYSMLRPEMIPVPGQLIEFSGTSVFVRDGTLNYPVNEETIHFERVAAGIVCCVILLALLEARGGTLQASLRVVAMGFQSAVLTEVLGSSVKNYMLVPRPNFYAGCGWNDATGTCEASAERQVRFHQSCPSGHSSHAASIATLLTLHLLRHSELALLENTRTGANRARLLALAAHVPGCVALAIAASRIHDRWHHPADVVAGVALGVTCATLSHRVYFAGTPRAK